MSYSIHLFFSPWPGFKLWPGQCVFTRVRWPWLLLSDRKWFLCRPRWALFPPARCRPACHAAQTEPLQEQPLPRKPIRTTSTLPTVLPYWWVCGIRFTPEITVLSKYQTVIFMLCFSMLCMYIYKYILILTELK